MILLDTDHLTVISFPDDSRFQTLRARMDLSADQDFATSIVCAEEQMRGWLAEINRWRDIRRQAIAYDRLAMLLEFLAQWEIMRLDERAIEEFGRLRNKRIRLGTQDLKIAAIALANNARLLSANLRDFRRVPGLRVENWLE